MKKSYKLTIVLLTYNRCKNDYLKKSLEAILNQTFTDFELLVVDNHSTDDTAEFVLSYDDPRLFYIRQPAGGNATTSYNHALWMSRGEYIIFTHDDDIMESELIENQMQMIEKNPGLLCLASNVSLINEEGKLIQKKLYQLDEDIIFLKGEYIEQYFKEKIWMPTPTIMYHRDTYLKLLSKQLSMKDPPYFPSGDVWAVFSLNLKGSVGILASPLLSYRQHSGQESRNVNQSYPMLEVFRILLKKNRKNSVLHPHLPAIHAFLTRFELQDILFNSSGKDDLLKKLNSLNEKWKKAVAAEKRAIDTILPFEIFINMMNIEKTISNEKFNLLLSTEAKGGACRGFRAWLKTIHNGDNLFDSVPKMKKIAILGSMLNAYLIVKSAQLAGVDVKYCLDSSPARIGKKVFNVQVLSLEELNKKSNEIDAIVLSSEHDQEDALKQIIKNYVSKNPGLPVISWKELAEESSQIKNRKGKEHSEWEQANYKKMEVVL